MVCIKISVLFYLLHELLYFLTASYISCTARYIPFPSMTLTSALLFPMSEKAISPQLPSQVIRYKGTPTEEEDPAGKSVKPERKSEKAKNGQNVTQHSFISI